MFGIKVANKNEKIVEIQSNQIKQYILRQTLAFKLSDLLFSFDNFLVSVQIIKRSYLCSIEVSYVGLGLLHPSNSCRIYSMDTSYAGKGLLGTSDPCRIYHMDAGFNHNTPLSLMKERGLHIFIAPS